MPKKGLNQTCIVSAAAELVEEKGLDNITLCELADVLGIKTASLYNHMNGLPELNERLAELALNRLDAALRDAVIGRSGDEALLALALSYRQFAKETPQLYKAILNLPRMKDDALNESGRAVIRIFYRVLEPYQLGSEFTAHYGRAFRSAMHGFVSLEEAGFFSGRTDVEKSYHLLIAQLLSALRAQEPISSREEAMSVEAF